MQLAARDVRIEAPIPGRNAVGIEIPNVKSTPVKMREIINDVGNDKSQPLLSVSYTHQRKEEASTRAYS